MKKKILSSLLLLFLFFSIATPAFAWRALKSQRYDVNLYTGKESNFHDKKWEDIPNHWRYKFTNDYVVGGGWNYTRYESLLYYSPN